MSLLDEMGHIYIFVDQMGLDEMGSDEMGINRKVGVNIFGTCSVKAGWKSRALQ